MSLSLGGARPPRLARRTGAPSLCSAGRRPLQRGPPASNPCVSPWFYLGRLSSDSHPVSPSPTRDASSREPAWARLPAAPRKARPAAATGRAPVALHCCRPTRAPGKRRETPSPGRPGRPVRVTRKPCSELAWRVCAPPAASAALKAPEPAARPPGRPACSSSRAPPRCAAGQGHGGSGASPPPRRPSRRQDTPGRTAVPGQGSSRLGASPSWRPAPGRGHAPR